MTKKALPIKKPLDSGEKIIFYSSVCDKNQNLTDVKINYTKFNELLSTFGFKRFDVENDFVMVKVTRNIIEEIAVNAIQDTFFNYLDSLPDILNSEIPKEMLIEKFYKSPDTYFSKKRYTLLRPEKEYVFVKDTKDSCFIFYKNGFVESNSKGWNLKEYKDLNGFLWKNQIHNRDFIQATVDTQNIDGMGIFAEFIYNVSNKDRERFDCLCTIIGYNLHTYFEGKLKATILTDSKISDHPDGRTGKSLFAIALSKIKKGCTIKGKDFDPTDRFKYQEAGLDDQIIIIDDAKKNFDFEMMFNDITEGVKVNKKNLKPFTTNIKMLITTNRTIKIEGASAKDRSIEFEFADYYSEKFNPEDEFKKWFFSKDFTIEDWILFDNFMMFCISSYLKNGVKKAQQINLDRRKLLESTNPDFVEFMDTRVSNGEIQAGKEYVKQELHNQFLNEYQDYNEDKFLKRLRNFTLYLRHYAKYTPGFAEIKKEDERKSNEKRFMRFRSDNEDSP
jgi:hypothetical protein